MKKIPAQQVCDILNRNIEVKGFVETIRARVSVPTEVANGSEVGCTEIDGDFDSSPLGFIQVLVDEQICLKVGGGDGVGEFMTVKDADKAIASDWDKYENDLADFNKTHGTNHKPEPRPKVI